MILLLADYKLNKYIGDELHSSITNLLEQKAQLQSRYNNLTEHNNLTQSSLERLQSSYNNLSEQNNLTQSTLERLQSKYNNFKKTRCGQWDDTILFLILSHHVVHHLKIY